MGKKTLLNNSEGLSRPWIIAIIIVSILAIGGIGYAIGKNQAEADAKAKYDKQVQQLNQDLDDAKDTADDKIDEGQEAVEEGQQSIESLQSENATLKAKVDEQNKKIADLEKQLADANSNNTTSPPAQ